MKKYGKWLFAIVFLFVFISTSVAKNDKDKDKDDDKEKKDKSSASILAGATTVDGVNYQQLGFRGELPIGKLGLGLDIIILMDEKGKVREEDWDEAKDYIDKIYYIRWGHKDVDPFYFKAGGLDFSYMGYGAMIYGYSNMVEYPSYKRVGLEMAFQTKYFGMEFFGNDFKELVNTKPSMVIGSRLFVKPFGNSFSIGVGVASDLNQYNGLRDTDGDGAPDDIDQYPTDAAYKTDKDKYTSPIYTTSVIDQMVADGLIDGTDSSTLFNLNEAKSKPLTIWSVDMGINLIQTSFVKFDIYSEFAQISNTKGWGLALPGVRLQLGPITFSLDYRMTSDKFLFGYFNNTYELERAKYVKSGSQLTLVLKEDTLEYVKASKGLFGRIDFNFLNLFIARVSYQNLMVDSSTDTLNQSVSGELIVRKDLLPFVNDARAYYFQNNVQNFREWKTPSTIMGYKIALGVNKGVSVVFDYRYTFEDKDGDGLIRGSEETLQTFSISSTATF